MQSPIEQARVTPKTAYRDSTRFWLAVSFAGLAAQVAVTDYGASAAGVRMFWLVAGVGLLWLIYARRSRLTRAVVVIGSLLGAVLYGLGAFQDAGQAFVALTFLGQALPLLTHAVRQHVTRTA